jgi:hypothetical protein
MPQGITLNTRAQARTFYTTGIRQNRGTYKNSLDQKKARVDKLGKAVQ